MNLDVHVSTRYSEDPLRDDNLAELTRKFKEATSAKLRCQQQAGATASTISLANRCVYITVNDYTVCVGTCIIIWLCLIPYNGKIWRVWSILPKIKNRQM